MLSQMKRESVRLATKKEATRDPTGVLFTCESPKGWTGTCVSAKETYDALRATCTSALLRLAMLAQTVESRQEALNAAVLRNATRKIQS